MTRLLAAFALCVAAHAQDTTAVMEGQVTDSSGGVVAGATVQALNTKTGYTRSQTTTNTGAYHLALPIGEYELHVGATGFAQHAQRS
jgi:Carboxypeptidase regulatory-like domain